MNRSYSLENETIMSEFKNHKSDTQTDYKPFFKR